MFIQPKLTEEQQKMKNVLDEIIFYLYEKLPDSDYKQFNICPCYFLKKQNNLFSVMHSSYHRDAYYGLITPKLALKGNWKDFLLFNPTICMDFITQWSEIKENIDKHKLELERIEEIKEKQTKENIAILDNFEL